MPEGQKSPKTQGIEGYSSEQLRKLLAEKEAEQKLATGQGSNNSRERVSYQETGGIREKPTFSQEQALAATDNKLTPSEVLKLDQKNLSVVAEAQRLQKMLKALQGSDIDPYSFTNTVNGETLEKE